MLREFNAMLRKTALGVLIATLLVGVMPVELLGGELQTVEAESYGTWYWPVPLESTRVTQEYSSSHKAVDIAGASETPIYAAKDGEVTNVVNDCDHIGLSYADRNKCYHNGLSWSGNQVLIRHYDGTCSLYGHMTMGSITVKVGQTVHAGQEIGKMGMSGQATGVHLHFAVSLSDNRFWTTSSGQDSVKLDPLSLTYTNKSSSSSGGSSSGGPSTVTSAYPLVDGGEYIIRSALSDKAIEIGSGNSSNGVQAQVWSYDTSGASKWQRWKAVKQSNGYSFVNVGTGKAMDIDNASTSSGAKLQQYTANNSSAQTFQLVEHNGKYAMIADCSGMAIDLCGSDTSNGAKLDQHPYHGGDNQLWTFESTSLSITDNGVSGITATTARLNGALPNAYGSTGIEVTDIGFYYGTSSSNLQKVSEKETQRVKIYWYDLGDSKWTDVLKSNTTYYYKLYAVIGGHTYESSVKSFKTEKLLSASSYPAVYPLVDGGTYAIRSVLSDRIIEVSNGKSEDRTVSMYSFAKQHAYMQWKAVRQSDGYTFINMGTEKALELHSGSSQEGDLLWQSAANGSAKQTFKIIEFDGNYALIPNCSGLAVAIQGADTDNSALLEQQKFTGDTSQLWFFERIGADQPDVITPSISEAYISDVTGDGYKVTCTVYDNVGITKLKFPTWTLAGSQDDLKWHTLSISNPQSGTQTYTYQIKVSDHNNEHGTYATHVYAYDDAGNNTTYAIPTVVVGIYKVNYNANGGNDAPSTQSKEHGMKLTLSSSEPTRSGYTFKSWNTKSDGSGTSYSAGATYTANEGTTLYAQWIANAYTIKYDANGGSGAPSSQIKTQNMELTLSSIKPTREGYAFLGWNTHSDGSGTDYTAGSLFSEDANITLYAQWEIKKLGDMDGDGRISSRDNLLIYNHIAKKKTLSDEDRQIADVDGDGRITARDNLLIYNHITGKASLWK